MCFATRQDDISPFATQEEKEGELERDLDASIAAQHGGFQNEEGPLDG